MNIQLFDEETGKPCGTYEIPDEIMEAANRVSAWMRAQPRALKLNGLTLDD